MKTSEKEYCYKHPRQEATTTCAACGEPICDYCRKDVELDDYCSSCVTKRMIKKISTITIVLLLVVTTIFLGGKFLKKQYVEPVTFDYGEYADTIKYLKYAFEGQPGSKYIVLELAEFMTLAGDYEGAIGICNTYQKNYGPYPRLNRVTLDLYKRLAKWDSAAIEATALIEDAPYDKDFRWWRGEVYEYANQLDKAIEDYTQSISLQPALNSIPYKLSKALEKTGRGAEAALPLLQLACTREEYRNSCQLSNRVQELYRTYDCKRYNPRGEAVIERDSCGQFSTIVTINDSVSGRFLLDQNATHIMFGIAFAEKLQLDTTSLRKMIVTTDITNHDGFVGAVKKVQVDKSEANDVAIAILPPREFNSEIYDGILGLSYLSRFRIEQDYTSDKIHLNPEGYIYF